MSIIKRFKQVVMVTGLLTFLALMTMISVMAYLWWDSRDTNTDFETDTDFDTDIDIDHETEAETTGDEEPA